MRAIHQRITTAEERISILEDTLEAATDQAKRHDKTIQQLLQKIDDLENRSRRNNLRRTSIAEGLEGNRLVTFVGKLLCQILDKTNAPPDVERAHPDPDLLQANHRVPFSSDYYDGATNKKSSPRHVRRDDSVGKGITFRSSRISQPRFKDSAPALWTLKRRYGKPAYSST